MHLASKLDQLEKRFDDLTQQMADPAIIGDADQYRKITKAQSELSDIVAKYREWKKVEDSLSQARPMLHEPDPDLKSMAEMEIAELEPQKVRIEEELKVLLLPKDPNDDKNVVLEIRAGTGGDEATLFAYEIFRMYSRYASAPARAAMRPRCSPTRSSACTRAMPRPRPGRWKSPPAARAA